jgi:uncharacterized protein (TIGR03067 family)
MMTERTPSVRVLLAACLGPPALAAGIILGMLWAGYDRSEHPGVGWLGPPTHERDSLVLKDCRIVDHKPATGDAAKRDQEKLQGVWVATEIIEGGKKASDEGVRAEFKGDKITIAAEAIPGVTGTYTIDPSKAPATMDITHGDDSKKFTVPAIYELRGDHLKLCHPQREGGIRPKAFDATAETVLATFERQKS